MYELLGALLASGAIIYFMRAKAKREDAERQATFERTMRGLEEIAKREGTFVVSYFDKESK